MEYKKLDRIDVPASRLVFGTPSVLMEGTKEAACECLEMAYENGFRTFDTANSYGKAEENIGWWISKCGHRDSIVLHDKGFNPGMEGAGDIYSAQTIRNQIALSQERLQTEYLDFYVLHRDDESKPVDEIVEVLNEFRAKGVIRRFGGSNWSMARIREANAYAEKHGLEGFSVCSPSYSLADLVGDPWGGSVTISGEQNQAYRDWLKENQMPVFAYSALARGYMSGMYCTEGEKSLEDSLWWGPIAEYHCEKNLGRLRRAEKMAKQKDCAVSAIALAWLFAQPLNLFPIINSGSEKHLQEALKVFELTLTPQECSYLESGH